MSDPIHDKLRAAAEKAATKSYSPYSRFATGAAVYEPTAGEIFTGASVENASYEISISAERVALYNMIANSKSPTTALVRRPKLIAIAANDFNIKMPKNMPSGSSRQVMAELMDSDAIILIGGISAKHKMVFSLKDLIPRAFTL